MDINKTIVLKKNDNYQYILGRISKKEYDEITELCKTNQIEEQKYPFLKYVVICAHLSEMSENLCKEFIPLFNIRKHKKEYTQHTFIEQYEYLCYVRRERNKQNITDSFCQIHEDRLSSLYCACSSLNTKYFYILKLDIEWIEYKEQIRNLCPLNEEIIEETLNERIYREWEEKQYIKTLLPVPLKYYTLRSTIGVIFRDNKTPLNLTNYIS